MVLRLFRHSQKILEKQHNSILSAAGIITIAVFCASLLGFIRTRLLVSYFYNALVPTFAPGEALDAYLVAFRIPDFVFQLLVIGALSAAFIPVFAKYIQKDETEAYTIVNSMINVILLLFVIVGVLVFIYAQPLNQFLTGDSFSHEQLELTTKFTKVMLFAQFFFAISSFTTGIIQAHKRFLIPALSPVVYNLGIIAGIMVLGPYMGLYAAAFGVLFGAFAHLALQIPLALKLGYRYRFVLQLGHPGVREMIKLMLPRTLAISVDQVELFITTFFATTLPDKGSYLIITLAQQLVKAPVRVFGVPIGQASLPFLSKENADNNLENFKTTFISSLHQILYLALPASAVLIVLRIPLVRILYGAKDFPWTATLVTGRLVAILGLSIFAYACTQLLARAFYALHNTRIPFISAIITVLISILGSYLFAFRLGWGVLGIAVGSTLAAIGEFVFLFAMLVRKVGSFSVEKLILPVCKMLLAASLTGIFLWVPMRLLDEVLDTTRTVNLVLLTISTTGVGAVVYLWLSKLLEIEQLNAYIKLLNKVGNWQKVLSSSDETIDQTASDVVNT